MSAAATNYVYEVVVKGKEKDVPALNKKKLGTIKAVVKKYPPKE